MKNYYTTPKTSFLRIIGILMIITSFFEVSAQSSCCPKFQLSFPELCERQDSFCANLGGPLGGLGQQPSIACKQSLQTYNVYPNLPGYTYTWTVAGGSPASFTGNPMQILWGNGITGSIKVVISNPSGTCKDSFSTTFCLVNSPIANFIKSSDTICTGQAVSFTNTSLGGSLYTWDFGDGTSFTGTTPPPHTYSSAGMYVISLNASNATSNSTQCSYCEGKKLDTVYVVVGSGPDIDTLGCYGSLCAKPGLTTQYSTSSTCTPRLWTVTGGTIIGSATGPTVTVQWSPTFTGFPTVTLTVPPGCGGPCATSTTINIPIIYPNYPIQGPISVCVGNNNVYSIPHLPGSYYNWSISGSGTLNAIIPFFNSSEVSVNAALTPGSYTLNVAYYDSLKKCGGNSSLTVLVKPKFDFTGSNIKVCEGSIGNYSTNGNSSWQVYQNGVLLGGPYASIPNGFSANINWVSPGIYTVVATSLTPSSFCNSSTSVVVQVLAKPVLTTTLPLTSTICPNEISQYVVSSTIPDYPYTWTITGGTKLVEDENKITVKWGPTGGTLSVFQSNPDPSISCPSNTITFTTTILPAPSFTGTLIGCEDDVFTYTATAGFSEYTWTAVNGTILSGQGTNIVTVMWAGAAPGSHQLTVSTCSGSQTQLASISSNLNSSLAISSITCNSAILTSSIPGAAPYSWYLNGILQAGTSNPRTVTTAGVWSCKPNGCYKKAVATVSFIPAPNVTISTPTNIFCVSNPTAIPPITFYSSVSVGSGPYSYVWLFNGVPIPLATNNTYTTVGGSNPIGNYTLQVTYGGGCTVLSNLIRIDTACITTQPCLLPPFPSTAGFTDACAAGGQWAFSDFYSPTPPPGTTVNWTFGDGLGGTSIAGAGVNHAYTNPGVYQVCATFKNPLYCDLVVCRNVTVPIVPDFQFVYTCTGAILTNNSRVLAGIGPYSISWSTSSGSVTPGGVLTASGIVNVTMSFSYSGCLYSVTKPLNIPSNSVSIINPISACQFDPNTNAITTSPAPSNYVSFSWNFGDATTSSIAPTSHAWNTSGLFPITLLAVTNSGCSVTASSSILIHPLPSVSLTSDTFYCKGDSVLITATPGYTTYNWFKDGVSISGTGNTYLASMFGIYTVEVVDINGCKKLSNKMPAIEKPVPKFKFKFPNGTTACLSPGGGSINIEATNNPNYLYTWSGPVSPIFTFFPSNSFSTVVNIPPGTPSGNYTIYLTVTDSTTGCSKSDTVCIFVANAPSVSIAPATSFCEGVPTTLVPTPNNPTLFDYLWSNGATTPTITISTAGIYSLTIIDKATGCKALSNFVNVRQKPDVSLFPQGCDTLCSNQHLYIPLPNFSNLVAPSGPYPTIQWYVDGIATVIGNFLPLSGLSLGNHVVHVEVTNNFGCTSIANNYNIFVKNCDSCEVKASFTYTLSGDTATFLNYSSGSGSLSYLWVFDDGTTSTLTNPTHVFDSARVYKVCLYTTNTMPNGVKCIDSFCICICICQQDSNCNEFLTYLSNQTISANLTLSPIITFSPPVLLPTDIVRWDFTCDGIEDSITFGNSTVSFNYLTAGNYVACARIERIIGNDTCWASLNKFVRVTTQTKPCECDTSFTSNVNAGFATSISGGGNIVTFVPIALTDCDTVTWDFGDGSPNVTSVGNSPITHTYSSSQTKYFVCMLVKRAGSPNCVFEHCKWVVLTSIENLRLTDIKVYPNPTQNMITIDASKLDMPDNTNLVLSDLTGRQVAFQKWNTSTGLQTINLTELTNGIYILNLLSDDKTIQINYRIVKY
jgi:PKD repeat protein